MLRGLSTQQDEEEGLVLVRKERALAAVTALNQMVRAPGNDDSRESWHFILSR
ncbi:MAG: hypothetical protein M0C28_40505 [Candidatus Moduliflexus flocculans]|nr:hypothetical protein [Candidatus Moduliflexus flocculans]